MLVPQWFPISPTSPVSFLRKTTPAVFYSSYRQQPSPSIPIPKIDRGDIGDIGDGPTTGISFAHISTPISGDRPRCSRETDRETVFKK